MSAKTAAAATPAPAAKQRTPLSAVKPEAKRAPMVVLVHGLPGVGKTTFASKFPEPIFVCAERFGADELCVARWPDDIESWADVLEIPRRLADEEHPYKTLVIDKIDDLEPLAFAAVIQRDAKGATSIDEVGGGWNKGQKAAVDEWRQLVAALERLVAKRGMNVVLVSHSVRRGFKNPTGENFDRWEPNISQPSAGLLVGWCKEVLFVEEEVAAAKLPGDKLGKAKGISTGVRLMRTRYHAAYDAKNRHSLPDPLALDYGAFSEAMAAHRVASPAELRASIEEKLAELGDTDVAAKVGKDVAAAGDDAEKLAIIDNRVAATLRKKGA